MRQRGRLTRLAVDDPGALLTAALDCLGWLVSNRESSLEELLPLSVVAAAQFGDAHALDSDTALGAVAADAACGAAEVLRVTSRLGAKAWRMGHDDYLTTLGGPTTDLPQIIGTTSWDPQLAAVMNHHRRAVHEEATFATLLADLRA